MLATTRTATFDGAGMMADGHEQDVQIKEDLGADLLKIHEDSYGKGAGSVKVFLDEDTVFVVMDELELQANEEFLIAEGHGDGVVAVRGRFQQAIETTFRAAVERATGRRVISFASVTKLDPNYIVEIFRLGPADETPLMPRSAEVDGDMG
jgi:uncharacterized protein YbcI